MIIETLPISDSQELPYSAAKIYIVQFLFQFSGELTDAKHAALSQDASEDSVKAEKCRFLQQLKPFTFGDIAVKPFELKIDGINFGLVYSKESDSINLEPGPMITFMAPWDGEYYT